MANLPLLSICLPLLARVMSESYLQERGQVLIKERSAFFGGALTLSAKELQADKILLDRKSAELVQGRKNLSNFLPALHFLQARERINESQVFAYVKKAPKGASLHTHLLGAVDADFIISDFTYRDNLYGGYVNNVFKLKFLGHKSQDERCNWTLVKKMRQERGPADFDKWLKQQIVLTDSDSSVDVVWAKFKNIFTTLYDMLCYKPVFERYVHQLLQELLDDNVLYTELKGTIMPLYELDGTTYSKQQFFQIFIATVEKFKTENPSFLGVRYIHSVYRGVDYEVLRNNLEEIRELKKLFPDFIAGFDFVGFEEEGNSLLDYSSLLLNSQNDLKLFFHAGETNWFGHTDLNLLDAVLLNSIRIGHGFAITKHPEILKLAKERNIPLEVCPISNQVLKLNSDPRNHPAATLLAMNYPIVVCNDDPSVWNAKGLSYDWYIAFMAMTPSNGGLAILKQFALNSINYSCMDEREKQVMMEAWKGQWNTFINQICMSDE